MVSKGRLPKLLHDAVKSFDALVNVELNEARIADAVEKPLYQYTTAAGLKGTDLDEQGVGGLFQQADVLQIVNVLNDVKLKAAA